jgi:hypothetical protein
LGLSASKTTAATTSESSVGSSSKVNSPVSIKPAESKKDLTDPLNKIHITSTSRKYRICHVKSADRRTTLTTTATSTVSPMVLRISGC